jgi:hypothetical protein
MACEGGLVDLVIELGHAQHGRCALTGLPFDLREIGTGRARRPFAPSLDRIDGEGGYTKDNVRLVCQAVNFALNRFGEDVFYEIAEAAAAYVGREPAALVREDGPDQRTLKRRYIDFVATQAPKVLRAHGGAMPKADLRAALRQRYEAELTLDEANAYGWAFRRLTEAGVLHPASGSANYEVRGFASIDGA